MAAIEFPIGGIEDGVVRLRFIAESDLHAMVEACRDPAIVDYTRVPADYEMSDTRAYAARMESDATEGRALSLVVADATDDSLIGSAGSSSWSPTSSAVRSATGRRRGRGAGG